MKTGDWLFTCRLEPLQFSHFENEDTFITTGLLSHSVKNCGLKPISEEYAKWFIENDCMSLFSENVENCWDLYENAIKELCKNDNIEYEGI